MSAIIDGNTGMNKEMVSPSLDDSNKFFVCSLGQVETRLRALENPQAHKQAKAVLVGWAGFTHGSESFVPCG